MAAFDYTALDASGKRKRGVVTADTPRDARRALRLQQLAPVEVRPLSAEAERRGLAVRAGLSPKDRALLTRQLSVLLQSGMQVEEALAAAAGDGAAPAAAKLLTAARARVAEGATLADALADAPRAFPPLFRAVVAAGEQSGRLGDVLERLATYLEDTQRLVAKARSALIYPALLFVMAVGIVAALMLFVVPNLVEQFALLDAELPLLTVIVIGLSEGLRSWGWLLGLCIIALVLGVRFALARPGPRRAWDRLALRLPVYGRLSRTVSAARFARIFATLSGSGATVLESLTAARGAMTNSVFRSAADTAAERVRTGGTLASGLRASGAFPPLMVQMAASGEQGRDVGGMMNRAAAFLESEFETATDTALSLMEPLIILVLGGMVGLIVLSVMLPILQLNAAILT